MPFTACHPAAVWPLARLRLPVSALVIGSVAPDIFTMLPIPALVHFAHTPAGLVTADVAVGAAAFVVWRALLGPALIAIAPRAPTRSRNLPGNPRLREPSGGGLPGKFRDVGTVVVAVLLGAATHLAWDSFTHDWMWGAQHIGWLTERHASLLGWRWMQKISDIVGLAVVAAWVLRWWRSRPARPQTMVLPLRHRVSAWLVILGPAVPVFFVQLVCDSFYVAITTAAGLGTLGLVLVALWVRAIRSR